jgi:hypothetical protein
MASTAQSYALTNRYQRGRASLAQRSALLVGAAYDANDGLDDGAAERFAAQASPSDLAAQRQAVALTDAYMAAYLSTELDRPIRPRGLDPAQFSDLRGVGSDLWLRSIVTARAAISRGRDYADARAEGRARALAAARTNVALASRAASREILTTTEEVMGYRRVTSGKSCALCVSAAGKVYRTSALMPIHGGCDCVTEPTVLGKREIPRPTPEVVDEPGVTEMVTRGEDVVKVVEHDELGPLLWRADHDFAPMNPP